MRRLSRAFFLVAPATALLFQLAACSGGSTDNGDSGFGKGTGSSSGGANSGTASSNPDSTGAFTTGANTGSNTGTASGGNSGTGTGGGCATSSSIATLVPLNLMIMFDDSGSMQQSNKWTDAQASLTAFFQDPGSAGMGVALRFFPEGACDNNQCDVNACSTPDVNIGLLTADPAPMDMQEATLVNAVQSRSPNNGGGTPLQAALQGAENWAMAYQTANPAQKTVVILVTDGQPNGCDENIGDIAAIAGNALTSPEKIETYAVGLQGSAQSTMDQIAMAGGTMQAIFITAGMQATQDLLMALKAIQGEQVACAFSIPTPANGMTLDPAKVNVTYTPGSGGMADNLGKVANQAACGANGGWYYDDPTNPKTITLCPSTCTTVQGDMTGKVQIVFGCSTILN